MMSRVYGINGFSASGKTCLIEKLIPIFKDMGLKVFVIKHDVHGFEMDREGKDTYRFKKAGAFSVMISSKESYAKISDEKRSLEDMLRECEDADIVLVEGYKYSNIKKLGIASERTGYKLPCPIRDYLAIVTDDREGKKWDISSTYSCPVFDLDDPGSIAAFILEELKKEGNKRNEDLDKMEEKGFTHFDEEGNARMVNVADKEITLRKATAAARVLVNSETFKLIKEGRIKKGDVLTVAQIAGIMASKRTSELIPMCHPIVTDGSDLTLKLNEKDKSIEIEATVTCRGRTGVEMEAICACSVAAMTVYDMCKAVQRDIEIRDIRLISKSGGVHGDWNREQIGS
ncbi:MAG: cyclic pyranopterin monophosphate synthase MoaC [Lachnospiraceae bacterium]|nr:cyclic pyranopterin monophosphate synthase MoaC [Lachnospiraceae bacterium]